MYRILQLCVINYRQLHCSNYSYKSDKHEVYQKLYGLIIVLKTVKIFTVCEILSISDQLNILHIVHHLKTNVLSVSFNIVPSGIPSFRGVSTIEYVYSSLDICHFFFFVKLCPYPTDFPLRFLFLFLGTCSWQFYYDFVDFFISFIHRCIC